MYPVGTDRDDVTDVELEREQVTLPPHRGKWVVAAENGAVLAAMPDTQLVFIAGGKPVVARLRQHQHRGIDRHMPTCLFMFGQRQRRGSFNHQHQAIAWFGHDAERHGIRDQHIITALIRQVPELGGKTA